MSLVCEPGEGVGAEEEEPTAPREAQIKTAGNKSICGAGRRKGVVTGKRCWVPLRAKTCFPSLS